jgi:EAL domain-containing protein (putative c-di-GMP-specific phosphodiesterase class I)
VNLSARQFADPKLVDIVARALQDSGLAPAGSSSKYRGDGDAA